MGPAAYLVRRDNFKFSWRPPCQRRVAKSIIHSRSTSTPSFHPSIPYFHLTFFSPSPHLHHSQSQSIQLNRLHLSLYHPRVLETVVTSSKLTLSLFHNPNPNSNPNLVSAFPTSRRNASEEKDSCSRSPQSTPLGWLYNRPQRNFSSLPPGSSGERFHYGTWRISVQDSQLLNHPSHHHRHRLCKTIRQS